MLVANIFNDEFWKRILRQCEETQVKERYRKGQEFFHVCITKKDLDSFINLYKYNSQN